MLELIFQNDKRVVISLTYVYGIGLATSKKILAAAGVSEDIRVRDLTSDQEDAIRREVDAIKVEGDLRREVNLNIKRLMEIGFIPWYPSPSWTSCPWTKH